MKENLGGAILRVGVFLAVCALGLVAMLAVFAQLRFETEKTYGRIPHGVGPGERNFVRIAGVEVGKVRTIRIRDDGIALVEFGADASVVLTEGSRRSSATATSSASVTSRSRKAPAEPVGSPPAPPFRSPAPPRHWTSTLSSAASALCSMR